MRAGRAKARLGRGEAALLDYEQALPIQRGAGDRAGKLSR